MAEELLQLARDRCPQYRMETIGMAMALSFAATKALFRLCCEEMGNPDQALTVVARMNATNLNAVTDMLRDHDGQPGTQ